MADLTRDCWLWTGATNPGGYGNVTIKGQTYKVHRLAYEAIIGPIPPGLHIDHLCRVRNCYNPFHMEPVTQAINNQRGKSYWTSRTHCKNGHLYDELNTNWYRGYRICRQCKRDTAQRAKGIGV